MLKGIYMTKDDRKTLARARAFFPMLCDTRLFWRALREMVQHAEREAAEREAGRMKLADLPEPQQEDSPHDPRD